MLNWVRKLFSKKEDISNKSTWTERQPHGLVTRYRNGSNTRRN